MFENKELITIFKALADENRLKIVMLLAKGELCACDILEHFEITQPTLSHHMGVLTKCGLIIGDRKGAWMHYRLNEDNLANISKFFNDLNLDEHYEN